MYVFGGKASKLKINKCKSYPMLVKVKTKSKYISSSTVNISTFKAKV
jgi:hypothetical protein